MDIGLQQAQNLGFTNPLPTSWLGIAGMPIPAPSSTHIPQLTSYQMRNLIAQIGYDKSAWDYGKIGSSNQLGRYQFSTSTLEYYGFLSAGSNSQYATESVAYKHTWKPTTLKNSNSLSTYNYDIRSMGDFLRSVVTQDQLAYQLAYDLYTFLIANGALTIADPADVVAGMIYVAWNLGAGMQPTYNGVTGSGAYAWRYSGIGNGAAYFNNGRYAIQVLSK